MYESQTEDYESPTVYAVYDLIIIGAGPGGIALAAEACASGINQSQILVLEKGATHNSAIRQLYPDQKLTTANYKGFDARCEGLLCVSDMTKSETIAFFDKVIANYRINIQFNAEVFGMQGLNQEGEARFRVESSNGTYESRVLGDHLVEARAVGPDPVAEHDARFGLHGCLLLEHRLMRAA